MITNQDRAAIRRLFDKVRREIAPLVDAKARELKTQNLGVPPARRHERISQLGSAD